MKLFFLLARVPYPTEKGDKLRAFHQIKHLSADHEIIICSLNEGALHQDAIPVLKKYAHAVHIIPLSKPAIIINLLKALFSGKPLQVGYYFSTSAQKSILRLIDKYQPDHIFCQLIRMAEYIKDLPVKKTLDYQDVFSKGVERRLTSSSFFIRPFLKLEVNRLREYEKMVFEKFDNKIIISYPDRELIPHPDRDKIVVVSNGVDTGFFHPVERLKKYDLVFTGNMGYPPNINSADYLVNKIVPLVIRQKPDVIVLIAGANPTIQVMALRSPHVEVSGWIPDMRDAYAQARIFIAPMQLGTGLQNKLLEAMAMKIPCITSPLANQALNAKNGIEILIGDTPEEYARQIMKLLSDPSYAAYIAENGYHFVLQNYSWETETRKIHSLIIR